MDIFVMFVATTLGTAVGTLAALALWWWVTGR